MKQIMRTIAAHLSQGEALVLVTVIASSGSTPRGAGSQMLVGSKGRILGTIGGGAVEGNAEKAALLLLEQQRSCCRTFPLHPDASDSIGMICGGDVSVFFQYIPGNSPVWQALSEKATEMALAREPGWLVLNLDGSNPSLLNGDGIGVLGNVIPGEPTARGWKPMESKEIFALPLPTEDRVVIFGGGHCAQALAPLLHTVGFRVTIFEERPEYACLECFPTAERIILGDYAKISDHLQLTSEDYIVIMTNGHSHDLLVEDQVLRGDFAYVGVIGSRKKTAAINRQLRQRGIPEDVIAKVHTPIGTAIKAVTPAEIGISIAGELIYTRALRREGTGTALKGCPMH